MNDQEANKKGRMKIRASANELSRCMVGETRMARVPHHMITLDFVCCFIIHAIGRRHHAEQSIDNTPTARNGDIPKVSGARNRLIDGGRK
tara:strand:- start:55 stop:324 length:270 start_codon:yes stop_codon:yes gene_type:complete